MDTNKDIQYDIKGHGGSLGGFALNYKSKTDHNKALKVITSFAKENKIQDYGSYVADSVYDTINGKSFVYIQNNEIDISNLYAEVAPKAMRIGATTKGIECTVDIKED